MVSSQHKTKSPMMESALNFVLGAVAGGTLGATEEPVNRAMTEIISGSLIKPINDGMKTVGTLGLGTILGATALTTSVTSVVLGVTMAASMSLLLLRVIKTEEWAIVGLVAALATTLSGAAMGVIVEKLVSYGVVSLLWALGIFTVSKLLLHTAVKFNCRECCGSLDEVSNNEHVRLEALKEQHRRRVAVDIEQRIITLEMDKAQGERREDRSDWEAQVRERSEIEKQYKATFELEMKKRTSRYHLRKIITKLLEFWTFSGIPMTVTASVTAGFGILGFGDYRFVFVILIFLVLCMSFGLMRSRHLAFWMFMGCMTMFATFAIAVLTVHAGQEVVGMSVKMRRAGQVVSRENVSIQMTHTSSVEAISAGFFATKVCQVGLGAAAGRPLGQEIEVKAIVGASVLAKLILLMIEASSLILGAAGTAGALLGVVGAAGVSMGRASALAAKSSTWGGTIVNIAGMIFGLLIFGKWDFLDIGLHISVAYIFATANLY